MVVSGTVARSAGIAPRLISKGYRRADGRGDVLPKRSGRLVPRPGLWHGSQSLTKVVAGQTCTVDLVRRGLFEAMAQAIHERWRQEQLDAGKSAPTWDALDESRKESSRDQARHIPIKLRLVDCAIAPLQDSDATEFAFTDEEVEKLAIAEHDRWNRERRTNGWTLGAKDIEHKKTPYLVPFEELPPDIAEFDRIFVRAIPAILAAAGLRVIRTAGELAPGTANR
jgi:RyR domain